MATLVEMPQLSDTMVTGKLLTWLVDEGAAVKCGDAIAEIETDKATMELESDEAGTLLKKLAELEAPIPIGAPIAIFGDPGEDIAGLVQQAEAQRREVEAKYAESGGSPPKPGSAPSVSPRPSEPLNSSASPRGANVSPVAQRMAEEHGIDLSRVQGSGPGGRIMKQDVEAYLNS